jgi:probable F420-dependent oxidoreductase
MSKLRPFRFGLMGPDDIPTREGWVALARRAEDLGYATLLIGDHYLDSYLPIAALMCVADATSTLRIGSGIFDVNYRHPAQLAKEAAALDLLSGGRFELGLGAGAIQADYDAVGQPFDPPGIRIRRLEESISILKQFFTQDAVTFAGEHYTVTNLPAVPKPAQRPYPPIFIGGGGKKMLALMAREADIAGVELRIRDGVGAFDAFEHSEAALAEKVAFLRQAAGGRFASIELHHGIYPVVIAEDRELAAEQLARRRRRGVTAEQILASPFMFVGTVERLVDTLQRQREEYGISYLTVLLRDMEAFAPVVARLAGT